MPSIKFTHINLASLSIKYKINKLLALMIIIKIRALSFFPEFI